MAADAVGAGLDIVIAVGGEEPECAPMLPDAGAGAVVLMIERVAVGCVSFGRAVGRRLAACRLCRRRPCCRLWLS